MSAKMKRRDFITLLGGTAVHACWSLRPPRKICYSAPIICSFLPMMASASTGGRRSSLRFDESQSPRRDNEPTHQFK
jgi:hypothetical protein